MTMKNYCLAALLVLSGPVRPQCSAFQREYPCSFASQRLYSLRRSALFTATTSASSNRLVEEENRHGVGFSNAAYLEDGNGHINPELAQRIFKWEREQQLNMDVRSGHSTREGLRWVQDLVAQTTGTVRSTSSSSSSSDQADAVNSAEPTSSTDDLIQEGVMALMNCMSTYEVEARPTQSFETFAKERIHRVLEDYLVNGKLAASTNSRKRALPLESTVEISDILETHYLNQDEWEQREGLVLDNGQGVKAEELVEDFLDETLQYEGEDQMWLHQQQVVAPLRDSIPEKEEDDFGLGILGGGGTSKADLSLDDMALRDMILYNVDEFLGTTLDDLESQVIQLRFGLDSENPKTQKEVAFELDLTVSRVRKIQKEALEKLRQAYAKQYVEEQDQFYLEDSV